jgi:16S rRNA (guanine527-N7)-methyltransferase
MISWGRATRLTAIRPLEALVDRHVLESVVAARQVTEGAGRYVDIGSGNGYPALPIKCLNPGLSATLLEPALRKSVFLRTVIQELGLERIDVLRERVDRPGDLVRYAPIHVISMRAVAALQDVLLGAGEALEKGGRALLFLGARGMIEVREGMHPKLRLLREVPLPGRTRSRLLVLGRI